MTMFLQQYFERTADRMPDAVAVDLAHKTVTYGELEARANRLARFLEAEGIGPNDRVAIFTGKNDHAYAAVLGVLKAGACWVPLGLNFPQSRLEHLVRSIEPKAILVEPDTLTAAERFRQGAKHLCPIIVLGGERGQSGRSISAEPEFSVQSAERFTAVGRSPDDLAYIIFTSGSTGQPKGVMVLHRNICQFLDLCQDYFSFEEGLRFAHHSDLTFDPSLFDLFYGWSRAGTLVPFDKPQYRINPALFVRERKVNVWFSVPSAVSNIVDSGQLNDPAMRGLRYLLLTGEAVPPRLVQAWYGAHPDATIYNVYGTTETAIISHWYKIPHDIDPNRSVPVGEPLPGFRIHILDGDKVVPPGEAGECVAYGPQISPGYWGDAAETAARMVHNPADPRLPQTLYRTGDLLRIRADGLYEYAGRIDSQVKVRGHRVELGEVEKTLERHRSVAEASVIALKDEKALYEAHLVGFTAVRDDTSEADLRQFLTEQLPRYMVPLRIVIQNLPLPRNPNGKVDRNYLADMARKTLQEKA